MKKQFLLMVSLFFVAATVSHAHAVTETISAKDIDQVLKHAAEELEKEETFLLAIDDMVLVMSQSDVIKVLKSNNRESTSVSSLNLPSRLGGLLKKAYNATRTKGAAGFKFKKEVADVLVTAYALWSDENSLQKHNLETWSNNLFDELQVAKPKLTTPVEQVVESLKQEVLQKAPVVNYQKNNQAKVIAQANTESETFAVTRAAPRAKNAHGKREKKRKPSALSAETSGSSAVSPAERRERRKRLKQVASEVGSESNHSFTAGRKAQGSASADFSTRKNHERRKKDSSAQASRNKEHSLKQSNSGREAKKPREQKQKPSMARESAKPAAAPEKPSASGFRSGPTA